MVGRLGIGNGIGIPFRNRASGEGAYLSPDLKEALVGVWIADQNTNDSPTRNIIKNKIPNKGGDFDILNAAYKLNSSYGLYKLDFSECHSNQHAAGANAIFNSNKIEFNNVTVNYINAYYPRANFRPAFTLKIKVSGLKDNGVLRVSISDTEDLSLPYVEVYEASGNGIHTIQIPNSYRIVFGLTNVESQVTLEQIPDYQGAFVTDGVDDLIVSQKSVSDMLGGSNEITVVSMIHQIKANANNMTNTNYIRIGSSFIRNSIVNVGKCGIYGYTFKDTVSIISNILGDKNDYTAQGDLSGISAKFSVEGMIEDSTIAQTSEVAWYWTIIANKVLITDEINQVIAYYNLDKYVAPDIYYDVKKQGLTNENHAEFGDKLIDYSGNGKDMQLYNFGWEGMSGVNGYPVVFGANKTWANTPSDYITDYTNNKAHITRVKKANNGLFFNYVKNNGVLMNIKETPSFLIKVSGLEGNSKLWYRYLKTENATAGTILFLDNGIHELPKSFTPTDTLVGNVWVGFSISPISDEVMSFDCDITIEVLPEFEGALVFDGVTDCGKYVGDLGLKDYTVVADRAYVELMQNKVPIISNDIAATLTPFIFEYTTNIANTVNPFSFGGRNTINKPIDQNKLISYQSTYVYNGDSISKLGGTNITCTGLTFGRYGGNSQYAKLCLQSFMLFPYSLSEFLIERQLKKRKLGTLYPGMVELRPVVKTNIPISNIQYFIFRNNTYVALNEGDYFYPSENIIIRITVEGSSEISMVSSFKVNGNEVPFIVGSQYTQTNPINIDKSPQKINVTIDSYVLYENMDFPYPFIPNLYWDKELKNRITWGDKVKVGSTIYGHLDTNLLPELYTHNRIIYKGQTVNMLPIIVEDYMYFGVVSKRYLKENEPKCILSPERLRLPNEVYKRIGCIPDISGHYNHGFFYNLAYTEESGATADGAIKLDGVNDYISITNLGSGGKQVLMKTLWSNAPALLYDQRYGGNLGFAILTTTKDDINNSRLAYEGRNENGYSYLNGIWNNHIETYTLQDVLHNITITNDVDTDSQNPTIGKSNYNNASYANMSLYTFMLFDEISTEEEIKELNEIVGIEGNTNDLFNPTN